MSEALLSLACEIDRAHWHLGLTATASVTLIGAERANKVERMFELTDLDETAFPKLEMLIKVGEPVLGPQLAAALKANRERRIPDILFDYLCRFLEGKVRKKPGPSRKPYSDLVQLAWAVIAYEMYLQKARARRKSERNLRGRKSSGNMPPHVEAAREVQKNFFPHNDYREVLNKLSKFRNSANPLLRLSE
jgi:hypothetical protein